MTSILEPGTERRATGLLIHHCPCSLYLFPTFSSTATTISLVVEVFASQNTPEIYAHPFPDVTLVTLTMTTITT
jgi:hypothetical protein